MNFIEKVKNVIISPRKFFYEIEKEQSWKEILIYLLLCVVISFPIYLFFEFHGDVIEALFFTPLLILYIFVILSIESIFIHFCVYLLGGRQGILRTFQATIYGATPSVVLWSAPFVNLVGGLFSLSAIVIGIEILHKMSSWKAILAVVVLPILVIIIAVVGIIISASR